MWQPGMALVDFTNPDAYKWFQDKLEALLDMGVDCFKTDFGERIPAENVFYENGADPEGMHNFYTYLYNKCVFSLLEDKKGKGQAVLFARSATAGGQKFPVHWGGDCWSTYEAMAESLRGGGLSHKCELKQAILVKLLYGTRYSGFFGTVFFLTNNVNTFYL